MPSFFKTGTTGAAHSECYTGIIIPSPSSLSNSASTFCLKAKGMVRALKNCGATSGFVCSLTFTPFKVPSLLENTVACLSNISCKPAGVKRLLITPTVRLRWR